MKILVTGGCGFIGSHLCEYYLNLGHEVLAIDNLISGRKENIEPFITNSNFSFVNANLLNWAQLDEAVKWADTIFHFASVVGMFNVIKDPISVIINNVMGCNRLLETVAQVNSNAMLIVASSSSVYGDGHNDQLIETQDLSLHPVWHSVSTYPLSKLTNEGLCYAYREQHRIKMILARIFNTIGPRQTGVYGMVVPRFIQQACADKPITVFGDGAQIRSFCDVRDVIVMLDKLRQEPRALGKSINIGNNQKITINELAHLVKDLAKSTSTIDHIPYKEAYGPDYIDISQRCPNLSLLNELIDFKHQWTLDKTIEDLIHSEKKRQQL